MGRTNIDEGESSAETCKSDDSSDRPLKKARYLWQIKGKYHMKKSKNEAPQLFASDESRDTECSATAMLKHCTSKCRKEPPSTIQEHTDSNKNYEIFPQAAESSALSETKSKRVKKVSSETLMKHKMRVCEKRLIHWQARQVAWSYFDNTINSVMEESGFVPLLQDTEDYLGNLHTTNKRMEDESLENRAVLMAIHSHGLQRAEGGDNVLQRSSETQTEDRLCEGLDYQRLEVSCKYGQWQNGTVSRIADNQSNIKDCKDDVHITKDDCQILDSGVRHKLVDSDCLRGDHKHKDLRSKSENVEDESASILEHTNFMDKAVAVAIQKKGLSTFSNMEHN